jgi:hypothetical protein
MMLISDDVTISELIFNVEILTSQDSVTPTSSCGIFPNLLFLGRIDFKLKFEWGTVRTITLENVRPSSP